MLLDNSGGGAPQRVGDQADGLRQLLRPDAPALAPISLAATSKPRVLQWPRIVLVNEFPSSDAGARFAFHLASALGNSEGGASHQSLLLDLAPAASRLPHVLTDRLPADRYPSLWSELAAGRSLATLGIGSGAALAVAAEYKLVPAILDQLPRLYEQLVRQLSRSGDRFGWIVMLALDHIVPLDRACWQAADDIVLLGSAGAGGCHRQAAALRSRLTELDSQRGLWMLPKRRSVWFGRRTEPALSARWLEAGLAPNVLPAVSWPSQSADSGLVLGSRADHQLRRSAIRVADHLRAGSISPDLSTLPTRRAG